MENYVLPSCYLLKKRRKGGDFIFNVYRYIMNHKSSGLVGFYCFHKGMTASGVQSGSLYPVRRRIYHGIPEVSAQKSPAMPSFSPFKAEFASFGRFKMYNKIKNVENYSFV